jgi:hypothetical protein
MVNTHGLRDDVGTNSGAGRQTTERRCERVSECTVGLHEKDKVSVCLLFRRPLFQAGRCRHLGAATATSASATTATTAAMGSLVLGLVGVLMASIFWGSNFAVTKGFDMKDGMMFQFWLCTGILVVGVITLVFSAHDPISTNDFRPVLALEGFIGGCIWCTGNLLTVQIVGAIGLGVGLSIWGGVSLVVSFVIGLVGVLGLKPQVINYAFGIPGVVLGVASLIVFSLVTPTVKKADEVSTAEEEYHELPATAGEDDVLQAPATSIFTRIKGLVMVRVGGVVVVVVGGGGGGGGRGGGGRSSERRGRSSERSGRS